MRIRAFLRNAHRWLALALGLQIAVWAASGVALSFIPSSLTRGETAKLIDVPIDLEARSYASPGGIIAQMGRATEVQLTRRLNRVVYVANSPDGAALFDARTGQRLSPLDETTARLIATQDFAGADEIRRAEQTSFGRRPAWRIEFSDRNQTRLYVSSETGEVLDRANRYTRLLGIFRGLHVMDYSGGDNAQNLLVRMAGLVALGFSVSGLALVVLRWRDGRYRLRRKPETKTTSGETPTAEAVTAAQD